MPGRSYPVKQYFLEDCIELTKFNPPPDTRKRKLSSKKPGEDDDDEGLEGYHEFESPHSIRSVS